MVGSGSDAGAADGVVAWPRRSGSVALAFELHADALLIDERKGAAVAARKGLVVAGTLTILDLAAEQKLLELPEIIERLRQTTFRMPELVVDEMLRRDAERSQHGG